MTVDRAEIPGYEEVREFNKRFAIKMGEMMAGTLPSFKSAMPAMQPGMMSGMSDMVKEMSKLQGVPVSQTMRMGTTVDGTPLPAASEAPLPKSNGPSAGDVAGQAATNASNAAANDASATAENKVASRMGGFGSVATSLGGFGGFHNKKKDPAQDQQQPAQSGQAGAARESELRGPDGINDADDKVLIGVLRFRAFRRSSRIRQGSGGNPEEAGITVDSNL